MSMIPQPKDTADWIWKIVASFCEPHVLAQLMQCSKTLHATCSDDGLYENICLSLGFNQLSMTKTRGKKPWKSVFLSSLCYECKSYRNIILLDINGGQETRWGSIDQPSSSLIPLCYNCYKVVNDTSMSMRLKKNGNGECCLPHTRMKMTEYRFNALISIIPQSKAATCQQAKAKRKRIDNNINHGSVSSHNIGSTGSSNSVNSNTMRRRRKKTPIKNDPLLSGATENDYLIKRLSNKLHSDNS